MSSEKNHHYESVQSSSISKMGLSRNEPATFPGKRACQVRAVLSSANLQDINKSSRPYSRNQLQDIGKQHKLISNATWVEVEVPVDNAHAKLEKLSNWERASELNDIIELEQQRKTERLKQFQREVKLRVKQKEEEKQHAIMDKACRAIELERKIQRKTAFLAQACLPNASDVMVNGRSNHIMKANDCAKPEGPGIKYTEENIKQVEETCKAVETEKIIKSSARQKLLSRKLLAEHPKSLPGGSWKSTSQLENPAPCRVSGDENDEILINYNEQELPEIEVLHASQSMPCVTKEYSEPKLGCSSCEYARTSSTITGKDDEEIRKQEVKQRAMLRRLFMDIEREQVKEYSKQKEHQDKIAQIKQTKEEERKRLELSSQRECYPSPRHVPAPEAEQMRKMKEEILLLEKERETKRYIKALRNLLKEKLDRHGVDVPPLCSCGETIWDSHPDTCANNCPFYKNPKAYERAVHALMNSCETAWE